ncbi:MAG TPA: hypothetical protein DCQ96_13490 [Verrucomicrobiales bacterium]|nr:hypothetical protein [Verrucomicrobiales bacterium]
MYFADLRRRVMKVLAALMIVICCAHAAARELKIPEVGDLPRIDRNSPRPTREALRTSAYILKFKEHAPIGNGYVILTDHSEEDFLKPLEKLAKYREATLIKAGNLAELHQPHVLHNLRNRLVKLKPKYVALAPRQESYRENMLLGAWELLTTLDDDPYLDVFPGILVAPSSGSFKALIDRTIRFRAITAVDLRPFAISQVASNEETRSLQKAGVLRKVFASHGIKTPTLAVYTPKATGAPELKGEKSWKIRLTRKGGFVKEFPPGLSGVLRESRVVIMHGHGIPGMSCSVDIDGIPVGSRNEVILSGSCFSAVPTKSDFPRMTSAPGGYKMSQRPSFATRYIEQGATVFFGHMRLSSGFPHLYPVLEKWMSGGTVGEAYQQLINGIIDMRGFQSGRYVVQQPADQRRLPQNALLYVVFGDPALAPFEALSKAVKE